MYILLLSVLALFVVGCAGVSISNDPIGQRDVWRLVWADEFDYVGPPDPEKWTYETGFVRNEECQWYTDSLDNARVEDGKLILECHKKRLPNPTYDETSDDWGRQREHIEYTSGSVTTEGLASWTFGRIEIRAKLPGSKGVWPAFWMLGENFREVGWPRCAEIDIMEFWGMDPAVLSANVHFSRDREWRREKGVLTVEPWELAKDFHVYAVEWSPERMDFYYDETKYHTVDIDELQVDDDAYRKPHFLLLNFAIGGPRAGEIDDGVLPQRYVVDYVRVYEREGDDRTHRLVP